MFFYAILFGLRLHRSTPDRDRDERQSTKNRLIEITGGQILIKLSQIPDDSLYLWARKSVQLKSGQILFQTDLGMNVLKIDFTNAYCISLTREINAYNGTSTSLIISPENVILNDVEHDNFWS